MTEVVEVATPNGNPARYICRPGTNDANLVRAVVGSDEYQLAGRDLAGLAIDVGAHIGSVAIALAVDYPEIVVVAVEPVPENFAVLCENCRINEVADRVFSLGRAAGLPGSSTVIGYGFAGSHRYIGNEWSPAAATETVEAMADSLSTIIADFGYDEAAFLKIDCEGCEWAFLSDPAIGRVREIAGEVHRGEGPDEFARIVALLEATHDVVVDRGRYLFQAVRR